MPPANYDLSSYGMQNFGTAALGHAKRTKSLVDLGNRLSRHPGGSLPQKLKDPNALRRCYDLMNTDAVTHEQVLAPHVRRTADLLLDQTGVVLDVHDTTEIDLTSRNSLHPELGQIGDGNGRGYESHNSLLVTASGRRVLGLVAQELHRRDIVPKKETPKQRRERKTRESLLWPRGATAAHAGIADACRRRRIPGLPDGLTVVDVFDRGGDTFEFLDDLHANNRKYVGRAQHNRNVVVGHARPADDDDETGAKLFDHLRSVPAVGPARQVTVRSHDNKGPDRTATVVVSWAEVVLPPPEQRCGHSRRVPLAVWAVRVSEPDPPAGVDPVEWVLLTNVPVRSAADAWERVEWYCIRWVVEEYHKAKKTGCEVENPQFTTADAIKPMIALLSVVAVSLLNLRDLSRDAGLRDLPATDVVDQEQVDVLSGWRFRRRRALTVGEFFLALARLGGHQNRRKDKAPGWLVLWRGWQSLQLMVAGARAARAPADPAHEPGQPPPDTSDIPDPLKRS